MTFFKSAATATALAALLAAPVAAQTMSGESDTSAGAKATAGVGADVETGLGDVAANTGAAVGIDATGTADVATDAQSADAMADTVASVDAATTEAINAGSALAISTDETTIGKVESVEPQADGNLRYTIVLDQGLGLGTDRVAFTTAQALDADGQLELGMSDEEFAAAVTQQTGMSSESKAETKTN